ncbi:MAG: hypothetical protein P8X53_04060 [Chromatiales bacterium]|jgi:hypothetical protein
MGAGKHIVESVPGLILLLLFGWAIISNQGQAGVAQNQTLPELEAGEWRVSGDAGFGLIGQINGNVQNQLEIMLENATGQLCVTTSFRRASKPRGSL